MTLRNQLQKSKNIDVLSSFVLQKPNIKLSLKENGEIEVACAPITMVVNKSIGLSPVAEAIDGTIEKSASASP